MTPRSKRAKWKIFRTPGSPRSRRRFGAFTPWGGICTTSAEPSPGDSWITQSRSRAGFSTMRDPLRRRKLEAKMDELFVPDYDAANMPSPDKRAAYALEHIAYRVGLMERKFDQLVELLSGVAVSSLHTMRAQAAAEATGQ